MALNPQRVFLPMHKLISYLLSGTQQLPWNRANRLDMQSIMKAHTFPRDLGGEQKQFQLITSRVSWPLETIRFSAFSPRNKDQN